MTEVWESGVAGVKIMLPSGEVRDVVEVTAESLKAIVRNNGIKKFVVEHDGATLSPDDFPITTGSITIKEYNEAK